MATAWLNGQEYEMGAFALHPLSGHLKEFAQSL
ncbi:hypothetical protein chiPu_0033023, partial [Chiloscyllium punctatum]|nr:hypothetical protein [Chiloscyllium punctatum]